MSEKRGRRRKATAITSVVVQTSCWASLNGDILRLIAQRVLSGDFLDYAAFHAVCKHGGSSTACPRGSGITDPSFHPRSWMMFPEGHDLYPGNPKLRGFVRFVNLATGDFARPFLPIFHDHCALDSVNGLLLLQRDHDTAIRLLHPFTGDMVDLPRLTTLVPQLDMVSDDCKLRHFKAICASVKIDDGTGVVTVMFALRKLGNLAVAVATSSDHHWRLFQWHDLLIYSTPLSFEGKLYVMVQQKDSLDVRLLQIDDQPVQVSTITVKLVARCILKYLYSPLCLAECDGEILVISSSDRSLSPFSIHKLADLMLGNFVSVTSIGDKSLFIDGRSLCVSSKASPTIAGNTVIFFHPIERRLARYCLSSGSTTMAEEEFLDVVSPIFHGPRSFIHHIFTCCCHAFWNKDQLFSRQVSHPLWRVKKKCRN